MVQLFPRGSQPELIQVMSIGFVGGGRIARIVLDGLQRQNALPEKVVVSDCSADVLDRLTAIVPTVEAFADCAVAAEQDIVFLAVHPPVMADVAGAISDRLKPEALVASLAPKFTIAKLTSLLGGFDRIARVIPNAPSLIGAGYNAMAFAPGLPAVDKNVLTELLRPLGDCPEVEEAKLEAYAVLVAMGPTYPNLVIFLTEVLIIEYF